MSETLSRAAALLHRWHRPLTITLHLALVVLANWLAFLLRFDGDLPALAWVAFWQMLPVLAAVRAFAFVAFRLYEGLWRYTSLYDLRAIAGAVTEHLQLDMARFFEIFFDIDGVVAKGRAGFGTRGGERDF